MAAPDPLGTLSSLYESEGAASASTIAHLESADSPHAGSPRGQAPRARHGTHIRGHSCQPFRRAPNVPPLGLAGIHGDPPVERPSEASQPPQLSPLDERPSEQPSERPSGSSAKRKDKGSHSPCASGSYGGSNRGSSLSTQSALHRQSLQEANLQKLLWHEQSERHFAEAEFQKEVVRREAVAKSRIEEIRTAVLNVETRLDKMAAGIQSQLAEQKTSVAQLCKELVEQKCGGGGGGGGGGAAGGEPVEERLARAEQRLEEHVKQATESQREQLSETVVSRGRTARIEAALKSLDSTTTAFSADLAALLQRLEGLEGAVMARGDLTAAVGAADVAGLEQRTIAVEEGLRAALGSLDRSIQSSVQASLRGLVIERLEGLEAANAALDEQVSAMRLLVEQPRAERGGGVPGAVQAQIEALEARIDGAVAEAGSLQQGQASLDSRLQALESRQSEEPLNMTLPASPSNSPGLARDSQVLPPMAPASLPRDSQPGQALGVERVSVRLRAKSFESMINSAAAAERPSPLRPVRAESLGGAPSTSPAAPPSPAGAGGTGRHLNSNDLAAVMHHRRASCEEWVSKPRAKKAADASDTHAPGRESQGGGSSSSSEIVRVQEMLHGGLAEVLRREEHPLTQRLRKLELASEGHERSLQRLAEDEDHPLAVRLRCIERILDDHGQAVRKLHEDHPLALSVAKLERSLSEQREALAAQLGQERRFSQPDAEPATAVGSRDLQNLEMRLSTNSLQCSEFSHHRSGSEVDLLGAFEGRERCSSGTPDEALPPRAAAAGQQRGVGGRWPCHCRARRRQRG